MKSFSATLALLGAVLLAYSFTLLPYKSEQAFMQQYLAMRSGQSAEYFALRDAQLTAKYSLQDFGIEALALGILAFALARKERIQVNSLRSRAAAIGAAVGLPILFVAGYVFDLMQAYGRGEFPHWADSMGIPLMGTPIILVILWLWAFANLGLASGKNRPNQSLGAAFQWRKNWWQLTNAGLWFLMTAIPAIYGQYWYSLPSMGWVYFFLSIGASRTKENSEVPQ